MKPVSPVIPTADLPETLVAEKQPEYQTLPVIQCGNGILLARWKLSEDEKKTIAETGDLYVFIWTFGNPVQPLYLQVTQPATDNHLDDEVLSSEMLG